MIEGLSIVRSVDVPVDPATAFDMFTRDMPLWIQDTRYTWNDAERAQAIRVEPGVGGRIIEVWDESTGEGYDWGNIRIWEPGRRFVFDFHSMYLPEGATTEVEVRFERLGEGTRVTLEHRGFESIPAAFEEWKTRAWRKLMEWFEAYARANPKA
jgi:hypothetical protein